jgi:hypothetical protein
MGIHRPTDLSEWTDFGIKTQEADIRASDPELKVRSLKDEYACHIERVDQMSREQDNKAIVGRWFDGFWGNRGTRRSSTNSPRRTCFSSIRYMQRVEGATTCGIS